MKTVSIPKDKRKYMGDLHYNHNIWTNQLRFYKDELAIFEHRLEDVLARNTGTEATGEGEHFQNQFIRQKEVIDTLIHDMKVHEGELSQYAKDHPVAIDHKYFEDHHNMEDQMQQFHKLYKELKDQFNEYLIKWM